MQFGLLKPSAKMTGKQILLVCLLACEAAVVGWCTFWPIQARLSDLGHLHGWLGLYSYYLSNLDVWLLSICKAITYVACIYSVENQSVYGAPVGRNAPQAKAALIVMNTLFQTLLLVKAVGVAVMAPEALWPPPVAYGSSVNVGLLCMYLSIATCLATSVAEGEVSRRLITERAATPADEVGVRTPLLPTDEEKGKAKPAEAAAAPQAKQRTALELLRLSAPDWPILVLAFSCGFVAALGQALIPWFTGEIVDLAFEIDTRRQEFNAYSAYLLATAGVTAMFTGSRGGLFTLAMALLNVRIRTRLFASLLRQEAGFYDASKAGEITSRLAADTSTVSDQVCLNLNVMMRSATQASMVLCFMFAASWRLTVVTFVLVPVVLAISKGYGAYLRQLSKKVQTELAEANTVAEEVLTAVTTMKAHAAETSASTAYGERLARFKALQLRESAAYALYSTISTFLPITVTVAVLYYGGNLVERGEMSAGNLVSFMLFQQSLSSAFQLMGDVFSALTAAVGAADKVIQLMFRQPQIPAAGSLVPEVFSGRMALETVVFSYPTRPDVRVLNGLSLAISPGEVVALVGPSGGGKSSVIKLLQRFYLPAGGAVTLDGRDVGDYDPRWLRRHVALVAQEPVLFARTIRRNIIYGLEKEDGNPTPPTQDEIEEAARQANAHEFITSFPSGYDTDCGDRGVTLSGGQKQRIAIARALVRRPDVLLLDEATSALDADSEAVVQEALERMMHSRTTLVVAHRLSTIQDADRIVVINKGAVQEVGTHQELLDARGFYWTLVGRQVSKSNLLSPRSLSLSRIESNSSFTSSTATGDPLASAPLTTASSATTSS